MLNGLDLFSGIGGLSLALEPWVRPIAYCENDKYCQATLLSRIHNGLLAEAPIWDDICTFQGQAFAGQVDILFGGFPCQDISCAGNGAGLEGKRSGLVFEVFRLVKEIRPAFIYLENVPAIRTRGGERVVKELAALGYDCRWDVLSAFDVGAPHKRERWWLLAADTKRSDLWNEQGRRGGEDRPGLAGPGDDGEARPLADAQGVGWREGRTEPAGEQGGSDAPISSWWETEPDVGRVAHGVPARVDRIRGLGNAVVPAQAREAFKRLMGLT